MVPSKEQQQALPKAMHLPFETELLTWIMSQNTIVGGKQPHKADIAQQKFVIKFICEYDMNA